ncbi:MAG TPA: ABC transporter permease [Dongiaceae bacterium]|jgi:spermidine/putrescine transport system permease protein|nr:ABC transporter permease [Dongiaceae bacterium]
MAASGHRISGDTFWRGLAIALAYGLPIFFILLPLAAFLVYSLFWVQGTDMHYDLTLVNYIRFFKEDIYIPVLRQTIVLCLEVAALGVLFGYPVAYFLSSLRGRKKYTLLMLLLVPLLMSYIIKMYAIRSILGGNGFLNKALIALHIIDQPLTFFVFNLNAVLLTLTVLLLPFAILPIFLSLERIPKNLLEASADLGAANWQSFFRVILPLSVPGVVSAATFVFILAIGDFLTPQMVGGQNGFTFGRIIYSQFGFAYNWPFGAALSVILTALVTLAIAVGFRFGGRRGGAL